MTRSRCSGCSGVNLLSEALSLVVTVLRSQQSDVRVITSAAFTFNSFSVCRVPCVRSSNGNCTSGRCLCPARVAGWPPVCLMPSCWKVGP